MTAEEILNSTKQEIKERINHFWSKDRLWDGSAGSAYIEVEVLGASIEEVKDALVELAINKDVDVIHILTCDCLFLHESSIRNTESVRMAYWKGNVDFADALSTALPGKLVLCEDCGWHGYDYCKISINGRKAIPGKDYDGIMEYCENSDYYFDIEEGGDEYKYYEVNLTITDKNNNRTFLGGSSISSDDIEGYKAWANSVKKINMEESYDYEKED